MSVAFLMILMPICDSSVFSAVFGFLVLRFKPDYEGPFALTPSGPFFW